MYGLRAVSKILKYVFRSAPFSHCFLRAIFEWLFKLMHMIYRWKTVQNAHLFHVGGFAKFFTVLK
jgi:hypothetical protein